MICHAKLGAGGIETACITQIREFSRRGYKIYVLAESGFYAEKLKQIDGVTFIDFKYESRESYNLEKIENVKDIIWKKSGERAKRTGCLKTEMEQLEKQVLYTLKRDEKKLGNAVNDNLSGLHIGDSEVIDLKQLTLSQKIDYTLECKEKELPLLRESIIPGTDIEFEVSIDSTVCPYDMKDIINALNSFQEDCYQYFYSRFRRGTKEKNVVWLGGGCGFLSKTVIYPMFGKDAVKVVDNIYRNTLGSSYVKHKHTRDLSLKLSPHVCKCTRYQGKLYDMGMGRIEYQKM